MRRARLDHLVVLDSAELDLEGLPGELEVTVHMRATDGGRFDELVSGRAALGLEALPQWAQHQIARCQRYATIEADAPGSRALALCEAAEALLSRLAAEGDLTWTLDRATAAWRAADALGRPFSVEDQLLVAVEAIERAPGVGHIVRSRGLAKLARPDVAMRAPRAEAERVAALVRQVALRGARGEPFLPGRRLSFLPEMALWPRSEDCLSSAPPDEAPLYELREGGLAVVR